MKMRSYCPQKVALRRSERLKIVADENVRLLERKRRLETVKRKVKGNNVYANDSQPGKKRPRTVINSNFVGIAIDTVDAMRRWPHRYELDKSKEKHTRPLNQTADGILRGRGKENKVVAECIAHYSMADVNGIIYELGDCVHVNSDSGPDYIGRILEFFETKNQQCWFSAQWFYYLNDTAIGKHEAKGHDKRRIFLSSMKDDNLLECINRKLKVIHVPALTRQTRFICKHESIPHCNYYYDMGYDYAFSTFKSLLNDTELASSDSASTTSSNNCPNVQPNNVSNINSGKGRNGVINSELSLLDLYSGCGGMSTGLCVGANLSGVKLMTRWAVDRNSYACESMKYNHPETKVRNESAEDFLHLIKEWKKLCEKYIECRDHKKSKTTKIDKHNSRSYRKNGADLEVDDKEYEVEKIIDIRCVDSSSSKLSGIQFKVHWKGYGEDEDTWEPYESLMKCEESVKDFVTMGIRKRILPLPGDVDVICGGPPCQGATGLNRFRNVEAPLDDPQNYQIVVFMDIVDFLRPRFVLMENVVDILKFAGGTLGRYALSRLVKMHYQTRLGMMVAGCYGIPQFRMRVFLWGASPLENLPPFPLPTHDVVVKGSFPVSWEHNAVAYDEIDKPQLHETLVLADAISDLPPVKNTEDRDEMPYNRSCHSDFQHLMRLPKEAFNESSSGSKRSRKKLFDHRPYMLNEDDFERTCKIPKRKGANFRDLEGVIVRPDNSVELDLENRIMLASGKPLVPDYAVTLLQGHSLRPFGRLWWDEIVSTVVTSPEPRTQAILHPEQDRVLTVREVARIQGFPDYYRFFGSVKQRYMQVGNAVAVPVAKALGYELGLSIQRKSGSSHVVKLPSNFSTTSIASSKQNE